MMNYFVYALDHIYTDETHTDWKFLGYFDDMKMLEKAKEKALTLPGFRDYPDGMSVRKCELNKIHWQDGFNSIVGEIGRDYLEEEDRIAENSRSIHELNLQYVFQISHTYTIHTFLDDERIIGVFLDEKKTDEIIDDLKKKQGFERYQDDFIVGRFTLNNLLWTTGFC
jgi:hypothetical protein